MFEEASSFDQDLCWELSDNVDTTNMFRASSGVIGCDGSSGNGGDGGTRGIILARTALFAFAAISTVVLSIIVLCTFRWRKTDYHNPGDSMHASLLDEESLSPSWISEGGRGVEVEMARKDDDAVNIPAPPPSTITLNTILNTILTYHTQHHTRSQMHSAWRDSSMQLMVLDGRDLSVVVWSRGLSKAVFGFKPAYGDNVLTFPFKRGGAR